MIYSNMRRARKGVKTRLLAVALLSLALASCVETTPASSPTHAPTSAWAPLNAAAVKSRYSGYSYRVSSRASDGSVYYLGTNGRFLSFDPTESVTPPQYFDGGNLFIRQIADAEVGNQRMAIEAFCANTEITGRKVRLCHSFTEKDGVVYLYGDRSLPVEFFKGYGPMAEKVLHRANLTGETEVLKFLAHEFPDYAAAAAAYGKWAGRDAEGRALGGAIRADQERQEAVQAAASLALVGWVVNTGVRAVQAAASAPSTAGAYSAGTSEPIQDSASGGVSVDGDGWVKVDGRTIGRIWFSHWYQMVCSNGYEKEPSSDTLRRLSGRQEAISLLLQSCRK